MKATVQNKPIYNNDDVLYLVYYGRPYIFIFTKLKDTKAGKPRHKVQVIKPNTYKTCEFYNYTINFTIKDLYEDKKDAAIELLTKYNHLLVD